MSLLAGSLFFQSQRRDRTRFSYAAGHNPVNRATAWGKKSFQPGRDIVKKMSNKRENTLALSHIAIVGFRPGKVVGPFSAF
jgi:hypothetical protein